MHEGRQEQRQEERLKQTQEQGMIKDRKTRRRNGGSKGVSEAKCRNTHKSLSGGRSKGKIKDQRGRQGQRQNQR